EYNKIDNASVGKSFQPFIEAVPRESPILQKLIESLKPFENRFAEGYLHGVGHGVRHPADTVPDTESSSSSKREKEKNAAAASRSVVTREDVPKHNAKEINLSNFDA